MSKPVTTEGLDLEIRDLEDRLLELRRIRAARRREIEPLRVKAWVEYHNAWGWPDDPDYRRRMLV